jgi:L-threonylcarbamoyladenylate synthase
MTDQLEDWKQEQLTEKIRGGDVFIYPTDTCYGIGCSIENSEAIERVYELKGRDRAKPVPVLLHRDHLDGLVEVSEVECRALETFWPGGLTLVLSARSPQDHDDRLISDGTMAVREPDLPALVSFLEEAGPIVGTSANLSGKPSPRRIDDVHPELLQAVDFVLGEAEGSGQSSTVAEWDAENHQWIIHREGPVSAELLEDVIPDP